MVRAPPPLHTTHARTPTRHDIKQPLSVGATCTQTYDGAQRGRTCAHHIPWFGRCPFAPTCPLRLSAPCALPAASRPPPRRGGGEALEGLPPTTMEEATPAAVSSAAAEEEAPPAAPWGSCYDYRCSLMSKEERTPLTHNSHTLLLAATTTGARW